MNKTDLKQQIKSLKENYFNIDEVNLQQIDLSPLEKQISSFLKTKVYFETVDVLGVSDPFLKLKSNSLLNQTGIFSDLFKDCKIISTEGSLTRDRSTYWTKLALSYISPTNIDEIEIIKLASYDFESKKWSIKWT